MNVLIVTDQCSAWQQTPFFAEHTIISADDYLSGTANTHHRIHRIINLCSSYQYQSIGYYVSLLAEAREQKVLPSILTTQDVQTKTVIPVINIELQHDMTDCLKEIKSTTFEVLIYFGSSIEKQYDKLSRKLYGYLPIPLFKVTFAFKTKWSISHISMLTLADIPLTHSDFLKETIKTYLEKKHIYPYKQKKLTYNLAILHNPKEKNAPSDPKALQHFIHAAAKHHIFAELIEKMDYKLIREYDALFIRETTAVNHHTYRFSRRAQAEKLVVLDDPASILKCSNKVYLAELMKEHHILTPATVIIHRHNWQEVGRRLNYPCVLKKPDSAFSLGVIKVNNEKEYAHKCVKFLETSEMIISQEFLESEFDWRIGLLNNEAIFACKYFMASNHWQIYDWSQKKEVWGNVESIPLKDVPPTIMSTAKKAAKLIGAGLYGVDLKYVNHKAYVIEINDNPNVDVGFEDQSYGLKIYDAIMHYFFEKIKERYQ